MIGILASSVVVLIGLYLVGLASVALFAPARATRFLLGLAGSASAHYLELTIRLAVGCALLLHAPRMAFSGVFVVLGWVLVMTTAGLFAVPWQWHHRFAQQAVPHAIRHLRLVGMASFVFGALVLLAVMLGAA